VLFAPKPKSRHNTGAMPLDRLCVFVLLGSQFLHAGPVDELRKSFQNPPDDSRIMMRWWWFGAGVAKPELEKEMRMM